MILVRASRLSAVVAFVGACAMASLAVAQDNAGTYPNRPVTMVVPYAAGGGLDVFARQLAHKLSERLGKTFVVENRPGAGTVIGAGYVAKAAPDGYTIMLGTSSPFAINVTLNKHLPYDPAKDFAPIIHASDAPFLLLVNPDVPVKSVAEWIKWVKAQPKPPSYGSAGPGSPQHLSMELLKSLTGTKLVHVPYRGDAPALNDLVAGHIPTQFAQPTPVLPLLQANKVRALAISSSKRFGPMAAIPTIAETGVPGFDFSSWQMIVAPAGTPKPIVDRLHRELKAILATPEMKKDFEETGRIGVDSPPPEALQAWMRSEITRLGKVVEQAGLARSQ
jgi:tripartite-type tricarboxylate transporter receptor subunit TctC